MMETDAGSVLEFLLSKGQIPSFSFPLDSTMFAAEQRIGKMGVRHLARYSRDTKLAVSELAPGRRQTVNGERLEIGGLYFEYSKNRIERASEFFNEFRMKTQNRVTVCLNENCGWVSHIVDQNLTGSECPICVSSSRPEVSPNNVRTYLLLQPEGLAPITVPHNDGRELPTFSTYNINVRPIHHRGTTKKERTTSSRASLPAPDVQDLSEGQPIWSGAERWGRCRVYLGEEESKDALGTQFVLINRGPEDEGFSFCSSCGASLHEDHIVNGGDGRHHRPYILENLGRIDIEERRKLQYGCKGQAVSMPDNLPVALGLRFFSDIALFRFDVSGDDGEPMFDWTTPEFRGSIMALRDALQTKLIERLKLMNRELGAGFRLVIDGAQAYVDIFIYDNVSGGAGLVSQLRKLRSEMESFLDSALDHLNGSSCLEGEPCSRACVGCLLDFRNRMDHDVVNRPLGWSLAQFFCSDRAPAPGDFGIQQGVELSRVDRALASYEMFRDGQSSIEKIHESKIRTNDGVEWTLCSPLHSNNLTEHKMRIDYFETYPSEIIKADDRSTILNHSEDPW
tara:strand:- start:183 stop:1880 length:1698 start_codon:yes stop_codon:yes gene_type:complete